MTEHHLHAGTGHYRLSGAHAGGTLSSGWTGRQINLEAGYGPAGEWLERCEVSDTPHADCEARFADEIAAISAATISVPLFRGRIFSEGAPRASEFGPPPAALARCGRYNPPGASCLYLCSSTEGVKAELEPVPESRELWIQQYRPPASLRFLDARQLGIDSFAAAAFWRVETRRDRGPNHARLGWRIAQLAKTHFDGMIVPGVRRAGGGYFNVVLLDPDPVWRDLIDDSRLPLQAV